MALLGGRIQVLTASRVAFFRAHPGTFIGFYVLGYIRRLKWDPLMHPLYCMDGCSIDVVRI